MPERATPERGPKSAQTPPRVESRARQSAPEPPLHAEPGSWDAASLRPLDLQRTAGNRAVSAIVDQIAHGAVQRVAVKEKKMSETLYNQAGTGGTAGAKNYAINPAYDMTRDGDKAVKITVRVQFLHQVRNGVDPAAPGAPAGTPALGALTGSPTEIPANDPDDRRTWATNLVKEQVKPWNGHLTLVGEEVNLLSANAKKRLPVTFDAVAVFGLAEKYDNRVIIHPSSVTAGSPGQPIDAGNYYINKGSYKADEKIIAAHEYGHLIGIPDEYSQSNEQMNALLHQAAPTTAPSARAALDKKTVERMVLSALKQPLYSQLSTTLPAITDTLRANRAAVKTRLAAAARAGVKDAAIVEELKKQLTATSEPGLSPAIPKTVAFQTTKNFSNKLLAGEGVEAGFSAAGLSKMIRDQYWAALRGAEDANVAVAGLGDVSINVKQSVRDTTKAAGPQAADAATAATGAAGTAGGPATFLGFPYIAPPTGLTGRLMAIPATWGAAGSTLETGITPAAFTAKMESILKSAGEATALLGLIPGMVPKTQKERELFVKAHGMVTNAAREASKAVVSDLLTTLIPPVITSSVTDLETAIRTEVDKVLGLPPSGIAALGPNPAMNSLATAMKARLDADKTATAGGGRDPAGAGKTAPDQNVTYSYQGLMGSHGNMQFRTDQFGPMVKQFNDKCKKLFEKAFTAEVK